MLPSSHTIDNKAAKVHSSSATRPHPQKRPAMRSTHPKINTVETWMVITYAFDRRGSPDPSRTSNALGRQLCTNFRFLRKTWGHRSFQVVLVVGTSPTDGSSSDPRPTVRRSVRLPHIPSRPETASTEDRGCVSAQRGAHFTGGGRWTICQPCNEVKTPRVRKRLAKRVLEHRCAQETIRTFVALAC